MLRRLAHREAADDQDRPAVSADFWQGVLNALAIEGAFALVMLLVLRCLGVI